MRWLTRAFGGDARAPRNVDSALRAALLAVLDRNHDRAEDLLAQAVRLDANDIDAYLALARLYRIRGEIGRAIRVHQNMLLRSDLSPERRVTVLCDLGTDFAQGGFLRRAIACFEEVIVIDKWNLAGLRELLRLLTDAHDFPRALELSRRLARREGGDRGLAEAELLMKMADAERARGNADTARKTAKRALRRDKNCAEAWLMLGQLEAERGKPKAALAAWARVPKLDLAKGAMVYPLLEATFASLNRRADYEKMLRKLLDDAPNDAGVRRALAQALSARGSIDASIVELNALLEQDSDDLDARASLGRLLLRDERSELAMREYAALIDALERQGLAGAGRKPAGGLS